MTAPPGDAPERFGARDALVLAGLLALALGTRAAGIGTESAWWDEYTSLMHLDAPSLGRFLSLNRTLDPLTLPLYYTLEYLWHHFVSASLPGLRALSVLLSLATVAALHAFARRLMGRAGAAAAGLCLALSPVHAHHGQGIRMYVLFILLALLSWMTLLELVRRPGWGRWCVHALTLFLLFWVHPFALLVGGAQAAWVVLLRPLSAVRTVRWLALFLAAAAPPGMYLRTARFWSKQSTDQWISLPGPGEFLADLFADDVVSCTWQLRVSGYGEMLGGARVFFDAALALLIAAGLAVALRSVLRRGPGAGNPVRRKAVFGLFLWVLAPPLALYAASLLVRPCIFPRYTVHCSLAVYLLLGIAVETLPRRWARGLAVTALAGLLAVQWGVTRPGPQRTDWRGAARALAAEAKPAAGPDTAPTVLVYGTLWRDVFEYNRRIEPSAANWENPVAAGENGAVLARLAAFHLEAERRRGAGDGAVWLVAAGEYFAGTPPADLASELARWGLESGQTVLPAIRTIWIFRVTLPGDRALPEDPFGEGSAGGGEAAELDHATMQGFGDLAAALAEKGRKDFALEGLDRLRRRSSFAAKLHAGLDRAIRADQPPAAELAALRALWDGYGYRKNGRPDFARERFADAAAAAPDLPIAQAEYGLESARAGDGAAALPALRRAMDGDADYVPVFARLAETLAARGVGVPPAPSGTVSLADAVAAVEDFQQGQLALSRGDNAGAADRFGAVVRRDPGFVHAWQQRAYAQLLLEDFAGVEESVREYFAHGGADSMDIQGALAIMHLLRGDRDASRTAITKAFEYSPKLRADYAALFDALLAQNGAAARAEAGRMRAAGIPIPGPLLAYVEQVP